MLLRDAATIDVPEKVQSVREVKQEEPTKAEANVHSTPAKAEPAAEAKPAEAEQPKASPTDAKPDKKVFSIYPAKSEKIRNAA